MLLDLIDSQITYRSRTLIGVALAPVRDMALLDPYNPRSVAFQTEIIAEHIGDLPGAAPGRHPRGAAAARDPAQRRTRRRRSPTELEDAASWRSRTGSRSSPEAIGRPLLSARRLGAGGEDHGPGMIYDVTHLTRYRYGAPVVVNDCVLRLRPRDEPGQKVDDSAASRRTRRRADWTSASTPSPIRVAHLRIETPHHELSIKSMFARRGRASRRRRSRR